ncbi:type I-E CRISPR-associated protein Cas7/Cse4/CasC [Phytomonospora endophytica]|uniref:CRISPR system Cascade subunit CasC n=1 Tax=Phytomonospora endophytica TaxID=714109 RepID=A0A841G0Y0_9ACTN|nr:type I-E CRISPR-associated protein Cas7/Cse4/CasC [Phytomonospora endophytica]MBB6039588.1 CRISPR system Cascade subunit CasC [Phytomonospora endophytica]GIG70553.1 type I-E CRISPR-associated protein Cas7/Cse4/CasC [Phytomonospora endophytica]
MSTARYVDIHVLQTLPFSNPNRDEHGSPKTVQFGGTERSRISSQSWKRQVRLKVEHEVGDAAVRTRRVVHGVAERLVGQGWPKAEAEAAGRQVARSAGKGIKLERSKDEQDAEVLTTSVLLYLPKSGLDELTAIAAEFRDEIVAEEDKPEAKRKGILPADRITEVLGRRSASINLFGRMLAELPGANVDGSVQMAHAFTTHSTVPEYDFFSAVDDIEAEAKIPGSGHINTALFSAGTFYRYANVNLADLLDNLGSDTKTARELTGAFLDAFLVTVPTGKAMPTAPMSIPDLVYISVRSDRPVSMASAFESAVNSQTGHIEPSIQRLDAYAGRVGKLLGTDRRLWHSHVTSTDAVVTGLGESQDSFDALVTAALERAYSEAS